MCVDPVSKTVLGIVKVLAGEERVGGERTSSADPIIPRPAAWQLDITTISALVNPTTTAIQSDKGIERRIYRNRLLERPGKKKMREKKKEKDLKILELFIY